MPNAVSDTHALIWYLQDDTRLSSVAAQWFADCENDGGRIYVPSIIQEVMRMFNDLFNKSRWQIRWI
ncbi:hypothetical protein KJ849_08200 [bacterium]|nr:hypothetical protein [bacterium]